MKSLLQIFIIKITISMPDNNVISFRAATGTLSEVIRDIIDKINNKNKMK